MSLLCNCNGKIVVSDCPLHGRDSQVSTGKNWTKERDEAAEAYAREKWAHSFFPGNTPEQDMELREIWASEWMDGSNWAWAKAQGEHAAFCEQAQEKTDADFAVVRAAADQARAEIEQLRESNRQAINEYALAHEHVKKYIAERDQARAEVDCMDVARGEAISLAESFKRERDALEAQVRKLEGELRMAKDEIRDMQQLRTTIQFERDRALKLKAALERIATFNGSCTGQIAREALAEFEAGEK